MSRNSSLYGLYGLIERIGTALVAPGRALRVADSPAFEGKVAGDAAILLFFSFVATYTREIAAALWIGRDEGIAVGASMILGVASQALAMPLTVLIAGAAILVIVAGQRRRFGSDFDLACVTLIPFLTVDLAGTFVLRLGELVDRTPTRSVLLAMAGLAYTWAGLILVLAWRQTRMRTIVTSGSGDASRAGDASRQDDAGSDRLDSVILRRARLAGGALVMLLALVLGIHIAWLSSSRDPYWQHPVSTGEPAPAFTLPAIDEKGALGPDSLSLPALRGQAVLLDFWATWCKPCRQSLPAVGRLHRRYGETGQPGAGPPAGSSGLVVVSINTDDPAGARAMARDLGLDFPLYFDDGTVAALFHVSSIPHLVLIDAGGVVRHVYRGFPGESRLDEDVRELVPGPR